VDDERESPSYVLLNLLKERGARSPITILMCRSSVHREHPHWAGMRSTTWDRPTVESFDAVIVATNHQAVNYQELADWTSCIVDTRNALAGIKTKPGQVWKA